MWFEILFAWWMLAAPLQAAGQKPRAPAPREQRAKTFEMYCLACHDATLVRQQRLDRPKWNREVEKMIRWGAPVPAAEKDALVDYLAEKYPDPECLPRK